MLMFKSLMVMVLVLTLSQAPRKWLTDCQRQSWPEFLLLLFQDQFQLQQMTPCRLPAVTRSNLACYLLKAGGEGNLKPSKIIQNPIALMPVCVCVTVSFNLNKMTPIKWLHTQNNSDASIITINTYKCLKIYRCITALCSVLGLLVGKNARQMKGRNLNSKWQLPLFFSLFYSFFLLLFWIVRLLILCIPSMLPTSVMHCSQQSNSTVNHKLQNSQFWGQADDIFWPGSELLVGIDAQQLSNGRRTVWGRCVERFEGSSANCKDSSRESFHSSKTRRWSGT